MFIEKGAPRVPIHSQGLLGSWGGGGNRTRDRKVSGKVHGVQRYIARGLFVEISIPVSKPESQNASVRSLQMVNVIFPGNTLC